MHVPSVKLKGKLGENIMFNGIHPTALRPNQETWIAIIQGAPPLFSPQCFVWVFFFNFFSIFFVSLQIFGVLCAASQLKGKLGDNIICSGLHPTALRPNPETWIAVVLVRSPCSFIQSFFFGCLFFLVFVSVFDFLG